MPRLALHELAFLESVEHAHAALDTNALIAARIGVRTTPVRMDSQAKYAALARGDGGGGVYLRLPVAGIHSDSGYQEKIWVRCVSRTYVRKLWISHLIILVPLPSGMYVCRTTRLARSLSKRLGVSSRILGAVRLILAWGARSVGILVSLRRGRRSMRK
jgi:hypothetical protein